MPSTGSSLRRWAAGFVAVASAAWGSTRSPISSVPIPEIERAWQTLVRRRVHSILRIALTPAQLEALGL